MSRTIVLMGAPGAGKGTQAQLISQQFGWPQISTGEILRDMARSETEMGQHVKQILASGYLVSDDILADIIQKRTRRQDCRQGYILDGFPRTARQAALLERLATEQGNRLIVINLRADPETLIQRLIGRRRRGSRSDDAPAVVSNRIRVYEEKTRPVIEHFRAQGLVADIDGGRAVDEVFEDVRRVIEDES